MSGSGGVTLDTIVINIETNAGESTTNIGNLTTKLADLKEAIKGGFNNINKLSTALVQLSKASGKIEKIAENVKPMGQITSKMKSLAKVESPAGVRAAAKALEELAVASEKVAKTGNNLYAVDKLVYPLTELANIQSATGLGYTVKQLEKMSSVAPNIGIIVAQASRLPKMVEPLQALSSIETPRAFGYITRNLTTLEETLQKITPDTLKNLSKVADELTARLTPLAEQMNRIAEGFAALDALSSKYGITAGRVAKRTQETGKALGGLRNIIGKIIVSVGKLNSITNKFTKSTEKGFDKAYSKIKQMGLSLLGTRTIFTATRKAVSEYMQLDEQLSKQTTNLWRALGAQLAPAIEYVLYLFKQFTRVVYSVIYALTGIDLIARANAKALSAMGKSAANALGNLQKFDDLNVVEFDKGGEDDKLIELDKIDLSPIQKVIDWMKKLKQSIIDAWNSGQWRGVGEVLAEGINGALNSVDFTKIKNGLRAVANDFGDLLQGFFDNLDASKLGSQLTEFLTLKPVAFTTFINSIPWSTIGERLSEAIATFDPAMIVKAWGDLGVALVNAIVQVLEKQSGAEIGKKLVATIGQIFKSIGDIFMAIPWGDIGKGIHDAIKQINWKDVLSGLGDAFVGLLQKVNEFFAGLFGTDTDTMSKWLLPLLVGIPVLVVGLKKLFTTLKGGKSTTKSFAEGFEKVGSALSTIALLGGIALVISQITGLIKAFADTGLSVTDAVGLLVTVFVGIAAAVMAMAAAFSFMDWTSIAAGVVILAGLAAVLMSFTALIDTLGKSGIEVSSVIDLILVSLIALGGTMALITLLGPAMAAGLGPFAALVALIVASLVTLMVTLPVILEAIGTFIETIAPPLVDIITAIAAGIATIIDSIGIALPPILEAAGELFTSVFTGIATIVKSVGDTIYRIFEGIGLVVTTVGNAISNVIESIGTSTATVFTSIFEGAQGIITSIGDVIIKIMKTAGEVVDNVLNSILNFIWRLGPAITSFVDSTITNVTKLVNLVVSGVEFMINGIIGAINGLSSGLRKIGNKLFELIGVDVTFNPISKVSLDRFAPKLATGTNEIPYEGLYHLHPGEAVVPKKYNPALGNGTDEEVGQKLDKLINIMGNMEFTNIVNVGNKTLYKEQQKYNKLQNDIYGTTVNI